MSSIVCSEGVAEKSIGTQPTPCNAQSFRYTYCEGCARRILAYISRLEAFHQILAPASCTACEWGVTQPLPGPHEVVDRGDWTPNPISKPLLAFRAYAPVLQTYLRSPTSIERVAAGSMTSVAAAERPPPKVTVACRARLLSCLTHGLTSQVHPQPRARPRKPATKKPAPQKPQQPRGKRRRAESELSSDELTVDEDSSESATLDEEDTASEYSATDSEVEAPRSRRKKAPAKQDSDSEADGVRIQRTAYIRCELKRRSSA